jgi:hypothetical protein
VEATTIVTCPLGNESGLAIAPALQKIAVAAAYCNIQPFLMHDLNIVVLSPWKVIGKAVDRISGFYRERPIFREEPFADRGNKSYCPSTANPDLHRGDLNFPT